MTYELVGRHDVITHNRTGSFDKGICAIVCFINSQVLKCQAESDKNHLKGVVSKTRASNHLKWHKYHMSIEIKVLKQHMFDL